MTERRPPAPDNEVDRRAERNAAKLRALVRDRWAVEADDSRSLGSGAAFVVDGIAYVLLDGDHGLGAALAWADRHGASELRVVADEGAPRLARHASYFGFPTEVFRSEGRTLIGVEPAPIDSVGSPPDAPELVGLLHGQGLEVVVEGDRLCGEVNGLEVARIVRALDDGEPILEVGVGRFDRGLTAMVHVDLPTDEALARVVQQLRTIRRPGAPSHPLAQLVPERWLRARIVAEPSLVGCDVLTAAPSSKVRDRLKERGIAAAVGSSSDRPVVAVCTVGVDLDAVCDAADTRAMLDPAARLLLVMPARDVLPVMERMVGLLAGDAVIAAVDDDWRGVPQAS